jgi:hypothetical protein
MPTLVKRKKNTIALEHQWQAYYYAVRNKGADMALQPKNFPRNIGKI